MTSDPNFRALTGIAAFAMLALTAGAAIASEFERVRPVTHAATQKECGECHMAFQPGLLPAVSWTRIMDGLQDHFGENASLPADTAAAIRSYLTQTAGSGDGRLIRITEQRWWLRKHDFEPSIWSRKTVKAKSNCEACHRTAAQGLYEDD
ncbi:nitrate/TMAO reductase-like tetraheme cytochrome c subunit [Azospirillum lipoferum]|uniref:Cytochrome C n=1 Tax=Azospirillum lipoferum TaxID=193 RepID=A0A5A9GGF6_AZOLI|nr:MULTISPECIES: diheme cytochrome c [Azospirillum]KAA0592379.1 cytochrome C [Azospirillum lipoferum]MCP1614585.1 nitrate/TMAO reductase-like tetraheme cytochrome c subunit [Azospirillum lipoferum]MDW5532584.1 diheme cytochrome c [Azospirillum sp. NL1]